MSEPDGTLRPHPYSQAIINGYVANDRAYYADVSVETRHDIGMVDRYLSAAGAVPLAAEALAQAAAGLRERFIAAGSSR